MGQVNSRGESRPPERVFGSVPPGRGEQAVPKNGRIPGLQRPDRQTESGFADVVWADGEDSNTRYPMGPKLDAIGSAGSSVGQGRLSLTN